MQIDTGWIWKPFAVVLMAFAMAGCAVLHSDVQESHPLVYKGGDAPYTTVYFIRPWTERAAGFSDNTLSVDLDGRPLLFLNKGEYTMVRLQPRVRATLTLRNQTEVGPDWRIKEMVKDYEYAFEAGNSYFIVIEPIDGEFRGVYFVPKTVDLFTAKEYVDSVRAVGPARDVPLSNL